MHGTSLSDLMLFFNFLFRPKMTDTHVLEQLVECYIISIVLIITLLKTIFQISEDCGEAHEQTMGLIQQ